LAELQKVIAVVDDDAPVRTALRRVLRSAGYAVAVFDGGEAFISSLQGVQPDCLLLDLVMSGIGGAEVLERLAGLGHSFPAVIMSGSGDDELDARALRAGARAVLQKPFHERALLDAVAAALSPPATDDGSSSSASP
jgi:two-component system, LuxR family, response regulator FixJ